MRVHSIRALLYQIPGMSALPIHSILHVLRDYKDNHINVIVGIKSDFYTAD